MYTYICIYIFSFHYLDFLISLIRHYLALQCDQVHLSSHLNPFILSAPYGAVKCDGSFVALTADPTID